ncbi:GNAT family acetyltransferase YjcF [Rubellimicrobium mesophilum DSM 19309]|uniref:GNAT family acetyltransferase YjcF n=1 Tax=Rubellimicrobium mesophilum DSM 19309 TaxID=442562 RepID=A0A017HN21_9RHOB|nr:GNAT family N-acetyltransferase [Rubellimicrobium mesophilum]EYD75715.1 GNAT family acetyltransferase YjcF [Rubellimicrobium mesophilum DSM 19309]
MTLTVARTDDFDTCLALRWTVFVEEQSVPEELERDEHDATALHLLATLDGRPVGTARLLLKGDTGKIGRVCVLRESRGQGIGAALIRAAVEEIKVLGLRRAKLGSQVHAIPFYEKLGFAAEGPVYDDAGIPHRDMILAL